MISLKQYGSILGVALVALTAVSVVLSICFIVDAMWLGSSAISDGPWIIFLAFMVLVYAMTVGTAMVIAIGAPSYLLLVHFKLAKWPLVFLLGVIPGLALLAVAKDLGIYSIICGFAVSTLTHLYFLRTSNTASADNLLKGEAS